jgi:3-oxoacyl-[acyl-carrier-protein] synthase II
MEEVVITGMGVVSSLGNAVEEMWSNLIAGKSGVSAIERFDTEHFAVKFAGEVKQFDYSPYFSDHDARHASRNIMYQIHSVEKALEMAGLARDAVDVHRAGIILGSGMGGLEVIQDNAVTCMTKGPRRVSPFFVPMAISNMAAGETAIRLGWMGPNFSTVSACATSNHAIMTAADQIRLGRCDVMVAGGAEESVCPICLAGFTSMKALSTRNDAPHRASRPFDINRKGFVIGEGAGAVVLDSLSHAKARGAKILAHLSGYAATCDAYHITAPRKDGEGVVLCIRTALKDAGITASDVGYVNAHGTSSLLGDVAECRAIKKVFEGKTGGLKINSTKSMLGHALGAASAIEIIVTVKSLMEQKLHKTLNLEKRDPRIELDCCAGGTVEHNFEYALSNSFGFGGHNSTLVLRKA